MVRLIYLLLGMVAVAMGVVGIAVPLLPTVPFLLLAAFCFARSNPAWEKRLIEHRRFGPPIVAWRERGVISRPAKRMAITALAISAGIGLFLLEMPWAVAPAGVAILCGSWIATRQEG